MNSFKLLVVFILLLLGSFAQRFQRHLINGTQNGYINGKKEMESLDALSSDEDIYEQEGYDIKFVGNEREGIELELKYKELKFRFCSDGCMDKVVIACYNSTDSNHILRGDCDPGQCMFKAGVSKERTYGTKFLWFMSYNFNRGFDNNEKICENAIMMSPDAEVSFTSKFPSCEPLKHDGNVAKLYIHQIPPGCPLYVLNAKKWTPPTTTTKQNSLETNQTTLKTSEANTTLWIGIGVGIFIIFVIIIIGFGFLLLLSNSNSKEASF
uniref:Transmembrane protein n=1 Tax=Panagrolaimus davidi TaxID=227884 RepID=A0A914P5F1_9BILA